MMLYTRTCICLSTIIRFLTLFIDANTIGSIASVASIDWGCAVQVMAAATIGSGGSFEPTSAQLLYVVSGFFVDSFSENSFPL